MSGYSDRTSHAFAFAAKHYAPAGPSGSPAFLAHPANVAVILTRYGADHATVVAGILHHVLEEAAWAERAELERKVHEKFGGVVLAIARDALEPRWDAHGRERSWQERKDDYLTVLANAEPRALDICCADELHRCGSTLATVRRLGAEYVRSVVSASPAQTLWWYRSFVEVLGRRDDWPRRDMLDELREMTVDLTHVLRGPTEEA
ncbi:MAG: HD domain-containing protein [Gemmatimonadales bacterium]|nr:HD domain-containing protein [Gemmatimonadales bacterium]